jgi:O-antigen ligase
LRPQGEPIHAGQLIPLLLLPLLALRPPENPGWSMAAAAVLIAFLVLLAWNGSGRTAERALFLAAAALALPAAWAAQAPGAAVRPLAILLAAVALGLAVAGLRRTERSGERLAMVLAATGGVAALHALHQRLWGLRLLGERIAADPSIPDRELILARLEHNRAFGAFSTPAALGGFLALAAPVTLGLAFAARGRRRWLWLGLTALQFGGLLCSASATATAALLGAVCLAALVWKAGRRVTWVALSLALLLVVSMVALRGEEVLSGSHRNSPWRLRAGNFLAAISMARDHPLTGVGPGGFAEAYPGYRRPGDNETRHVHDLPLELCAELGWVAGPLLGLAFFWLFLRPLWRERDRSPPWRRGLAVGLAAFAIQNLADFTAFLPSLLWMAALLRGWLARPGPEATRPAGDPAGRAVAGSGLVVATAVALLLAAAGVADHYRHVARRAAYAGEPERAELLAGHAAALAPWDPDAALALARMTGLASPLAGAGPERVSLALERAERAVRLAPVRPGARATRAEARMAAGDFPGAFVDIAQASDLYPMNEEYAALRARLEAATGEAIRRAGEGR